MNIQLLTEIEQTTKETLSRMNMETQVVVEMSGEEGVKIVITPNEAAAEGEHTNLGALIGFHGMTLRSLQLVLSLMLNRGREEWLPVAVDVDGYREKREASLAALAKRSMEKVRFLKEEIILPPMNAYDRRLVHMAVSLAEDMASESIGEEPRRRVVIRLRGAQPSAPAEKPENEPAD